MAGIVEQLTELLAGSLEAAEAAGVFSVAIQTTRAYDTDLQLEDTSIISVLVVPMLWRRRKESNGTWTRDTRIEILIRKRFAGDYTTVDLDPYFELCENIDDYLADTANQVLSPIITPSGTSLGEYIEPDETDVDRDIVKQLGVHWVPKHLLQYRQFTGVVRVAYQVPQAY